MEMQNIDDFIETILVDKGTTELDEGAKSELVNDMKERLIDQINQAAVKQLSEDKAAELATLVDDPEFTDEKLTEFIQNAGVNISEIALNTMLRFRESILNTKEQTND